MEHSLKKETNLARRNDKADSKPQDDALVTAAKTIGTTAGKIASFIGVAADTKPAKPKTGKLVPKTKSRLPRRQKKAQRKKQGPKRA